MWDDDRIASWKPCELRIQRGQADRSLQTTTAGDDATDTVIRALRSFVLSDLSVWHFLVAPASDTSNCPVAMATWGQKEREGIT